MNKIRFWLSHPYLPAIAVLLAVSLTLPSLWNGLIFDDNFHRLVQLETIPRSEHSASPLNMFFFSDGNELRTQRWMNFGYLPWWTPKTFQVCFFRPLTSITHWIDYRLWPDIPALMHLQSLIWFGILVSLTALLYRRITGLAWVAGLAALFFAVDPAHGTPVGWIANRNVLVACVFGVLCLTLHDRWRREGWRSGILLGPVCFALALLSAEAGIAIGGYLLAYTLFLECGSPGKRIASLIPYGLVLFPWFFLYFLLGCGVEGMPFYIDPFKNPLTYLTSLFLHAPVYLLGQWALPPIFVHSFLPSFMHKAGWVFIVFLTLVLAPLVRKDRIARFWATGMLLSLFPICAVWPDDRNLLFVGLGAMGLLAQWFNWIYQVDWNLKSRLWRIATRIVLVLFILIHAVIHPVSLPRSARALALVYEQVKKASASLPSGQENETQTFILVNNPTHFLFVYSVISHRFTRGELTPIIALTSGDHPLSFTRKDLHTIEIQAGSRSLTDLDAFLISKEFTVQPGQIVRLSDISIEVLEVREGLPSAAVFRFSVPLEGSSLLWFRWQDGEYVPFPPPAIGETIAIERARFPMG